MEHPDDDDFLPHGSLNNRGRRQGYASNYGNHDGDGSYYYPSYQNNQYQSTSTWGFGFFTGTNFGVLVALIVIAILQWKGTFWSWFHIIKVQGIWNTLIDVVFGAMDTIRAYYQISLELLRSLRLLLGLEDDTVGGVRRGLRSHSGSEPPPLLLSDEQQEEEDNQTTTARRKRLAARPNQNKTRLPELESSSFATDNGSQTPRNGKVSSLQQHKSYSQPASPQMRQSRQQQLLNRDDIEPAFLNDEDYPPGWLVYHSVLGVVPKEEADQHDRERRNGGSDISVLPSSIAASG
jgi:hypothetical protein